MNFTTDDYLNYDEMKQLIESEYTHDKATIVCNKLIKYCFVFNDELYVLQQNKTYQVMLNLKASLVNSVSFIIQERSGAHLRFRRAERRPSEIYIERHEILQKQCGSYSRALTNCSRVCADS